MKSIDRRHRAPFSEETYEHVRRRLAEGWLQQDIAAELGWNQGRVSEINTGRRGLGTSLEPTLL